MRFEILLERIALIGPEMKKKRGLVSPYPCKSPNVAWHFSQHCQRSSQIMLSIVLLGVSWRTQGLRSTQLLQGCWFNSKIGVVPATPWQPAIQINKKDSPFLYPFFRFGFLSLRFSDRVVTTPLTWHRICMERLEIERHGKGRPRPSLNYDSHDSA
jgi:hypothetical protein